MPDQTILVGNPIDWFRFFLALGVLISLFAGITFFYLRTPVRFVGVGVLALFLLLFTRSSFFVYTINWATISNNWTPLFGPGMVFLLMAIIFWMGCFTGRVAHHSQIAR